jgi:ATP-dependent Zn protease
MDDALLRPGRLEVQIEIGLPKVRTSTCTVCFVKFANLYKNKSFPEYDKLERKLLSRLYFHLLGIVSRD